MGYPIFGKVKTIVLPGNENTMTSQLTLEEYKKRFGIDLTDFIYLAENGNIDLKNCENTLFLGVDFNGILIPLSILSRSTYSAGSQSGSLTLGFKNSGDEDYCGIVLHIDATEPFELGSLVVGPYIA